MGRRERCALYGREDMTRLIINRAKWGRGSCYRSGMPCDVLGWFDVLERGVIPHAAHWLGQWCIRCAIIEANDDMPNGPERERRIADLLAEAGVEVVYEGEYAT